MKRIRIEILFVHTKGVPVEQVRNNDELNLIELEKQEFHPE